MSIQEQADALVELHAAFELNSSQDNRDVIEEVDNQIGPVLEVDGEGDMFIMKMKGSAVEE